MAEIHGGQIAARQLAAAGIGTVFGVVAGPMIELFAGAQEQGLRVIGCRHEENAAFMASAWGFAPEAHFVVHDASGKSIVIEYVGGKTAFFEFPAGDVCGHLHAVQVGETALPFRERC